MIDLFHLTFCLQNHDTECPWYQEEQLEGDAWTKPAHTDWQAYMTKFEDKFAKPLGREPNPALIRETFANVNRLIDKTEDSVLTLLQLVTRRRLFWSYVSEKQQPRDFAPEAGAASDDEDDAAPSESVSPPSSQPAPSPPPKKSAVETLKKSGKA